MGRRAWQFLSVGRRRWADLVGRRRPHAGPGVRAPDWVSAQESGEPVDRPGVGEGFDGGAERARNPQGVGDLGGRDPTGGLDELVIVCGVLTRRDGEVPPRAQTVRRPGNLPASGPCWDPAASRSCARVVPSGDEAPAVAAWNAERPPRQDVPPRRPVRWQAGTRGRHPDDGDPDQSAAVTPPRSWGERPFADGHPTRLSVPAEADRRVPTGRDSWPYPSPSFSRMVSTCHFLA